MKKTYIVLRVGLQDNVNPIEEVEKIINEIGFCWFAKYGEKLSSSLQERIEKYNDVAICLVHKEKDSYKFRVYNAQEISLTPTLVKGTYPEYYSHFMNRVGMFIKISPFKDGVITIDDLVVSSSYLDLKTALQKSMRGHFNCKLKKVQI
jgi:hypothetical protein